MNFLRNRLVVLGLVLLATLLLYLLLPSIRQGSMEPSLEAQRLGLMATPPPPLPTINVSVRTGQLPGDPPLFFREALPIDGAGRQILPRLQVVLLHGQAFTSKTWEELGTMALLATNGYQALAMDLPGRTEVLLHIINTNLGDCSHITIKLDFSLTPVCFSLQTPTLIVFGALDTNLGAQSHKNLLQLPHHFVLKLEGARHACYMDKPREFHQGLIDFLSKLK
ncbi:protein ABHD14A-like [Seriola lalandi dorsalis]|uniref:Abhydrolase domain containing 14A n=1 Tax=Seriola lalandi dorsalis TaxID=1841481 RepID=A0A3B4YSL9_SERLL|nr:protein ABHD14A-like [Seriola lalandi dorsalis]